MSGLNSGNRKDYSKYDKMSTESLEELLRLDVELPDGEGSDIDEILYISEVIAKRDREQPTGRYSKADVDAAWETFQTKYLPYATDGRSLYDFDDDEPSSTKDTALDMLSPSEKKRISARGRRFLGRMASVAAAIALLLGIMTVTAYAMGYDLWGVIAQWTKDTFTFVSTSKANNQETLNTDGVLGDGEYENLQAALDAYGVSASLAPNWYPDGYVMEPAIVSELSNETLFYICGKNNDRMLALQIYKHNNSEDIDYATWQKDDINITTMEIENIVFYLMTNAERNTVVWSNGPFECSISGDISSAELSKMIESIFE